MPLSRTVLAGSVLIVLLLAGAVVAVVPIYNGQTIAQLVQQYLMPQALGTGIAPTLSITYADGSVKSYGGQLVSFSLTDNNGQPVVEVDLTATVTFSYNGSATGYTLTGTSTAMIDGATTSTTTIGGSGSLTSVMSNTLKTITFTPTWGGAAKFPVTNSTMMSKISAEGKHSLDFAVNNVVLTVTYADGSSISKTIPSATIGHVDLTYSVTQTGTATVTAPTISGTPTTSTTPLPPVVGGTFTLEITASGKGTTNPLPGLYPYNGGTQVTVTGIPAGGQYWVVEIDLDGVAVTSPGVSSYTVTMDKSHTVAVYFGPYGVASLLRPTVQF